MPDRPQDVVARGFDAGADRFAAWQSGLKLARDDLETIEEPEGPATFLWVLARR